MTTKRSLRNSNACPSIQNPFISDRDDPIKLYVPPSITQYIPQNSSITCSHITTLPIFNSPNTIDDALQQMKRASKWQSTQISQLKSQDKNSFGQIDQLHSQQEGMKDLKNQPLEDKERPEGEIIEDLDYQGFLMDPFHQMQ